MVTHATGERLLGGKITLYKCRRHGIILDNHEHTKANAVGMAYTKNLSASPDCNGYPAEDGCVGLVAE